MYNYKYLVRLVSLLFMYSIPTSFLNFIILVTAVFDACTEHKVGQVDKEFAEKSYWSELITQQRATDF